MSTTNAEAEKSAVPTTPNESETAAAEVGKAGSGRKRPAKTSAAEKPSKRKAAAKKKAGYLAAAGLYALDNNVERLRDDHDRARALGNALSGLDYVSQVLPVESNIVIFDLREGSTGEQFLEHLRQRDVLAMDLSDRTIRCVFHLDISDAQLERVLDAVGSFG